jgi:hypothetical protein
LTPGTEKAGKTPPSSGRRTAAPTERQHGPSPGKNRGSDDRRTPARTEFGNGKTIPEPPLGTNEAVISQQPRQERRGSTQTPAGRVLPSPPAQPYHVEPSQ